MFILSLIIGLVTLIMLVTGVLVDRTVCYPLRNPENSTLLDLIDEYGHNLNTDPPIEVKRSLISCYQNDSIYKVMNLKTIFDIQTLDNKFNISKYIDQMDQLLNSMHLENYTILNTHNKNTLHELANFEFGIDFTKFKDEVSC